jgi:cobalamin biosynthesis protein CobD/CbiB
MKLLDEVQEKIDEKEFMGIVGKNAAYAVVLSGVLVGLVYWLVMSVFPWFFGAAGDVQPTLYIIVFVTSFVFCYVFRNEYLPDITIDAAGYKTDNKGKWNKIIGCCIWVAVSIAYSFVMYFCGEVIVVSLLVLGIVLTVLFLATDLSITCILTVREIKQKIENINNPKEKANEQTMLSCNQEVP